MKNGVFLSKKVINELMKFASKSDGRLALEGLRIDTSDKGKPIIEATDGHRMHKVQVDNIGVNAIDTHGLIQGAIDKNSPFIALSPEEAIDTIFKVKEIQSISKMHNRKSQYFVNLTIKITAKRVLFIAHDKVLIRYIEPSGGIPKELIGMKVGINIKYLIDALEVFKGLGITIKIDDRLSPILIEPIKVDNMMLHIVMPVNMPGDGGRIS